MWGYGLRYKYGMFEQRLIDGKQVEFPDYWQELTLAHFKAQLERFYGIGGARRCCVARFKGMVGGV